MCVGSAPPRECSGLGLDRTQRPRHEKGTTHRRRNASAAPQLNTTARVSSLTRSLAHSLTRSLAHSLTRSLAHSLTHSHTHTHTLTHSLTHTHTHTLTHSHTPHTHTTHTHHTPQHTPPHTHTPHTHIHTTHHTPPPPDLFQCSLSRETLAVNAMCGVDGAVAAARRRGRRLRAMLRHERQSVAMSLAEALHHSAPKVRTVPYVAPRSKMTVRAAGARPGVLQDPEAHGRAVTDEYVAAPLPSGDLKISTCLFSVTSSVIQGSRVTFPVIGSTLRC